MGQVAATYYLVRNSELAARYWTVDLRSVLRYSLSVRELPVAIAGAQLHRERSAAGYPEHIYARPPSFERTAPPVWNVPIRDEVRPFSE